MGEPERENREEYSGFSVEVLGSKEPEKEGGELSKTRCKEGNLEKVS